MPTTSTRWRRFYRRRFLNRARFHQGAHVIADVDVETWDGRRSVQADLVVADCSRCVTLDFQVSTRADAANALHKLGVLRSVLEEFELAYRAALDEADLAPRRR